MKNYNESSKVAIGLTFDFINQRRKDLGISQSKLAELIAINESTLIRNLKKETEMSLATYFKICGALKLRPYLVPSEDDDTEMKYVHFN